VKHRASRFQELSGGARAHFRKIPEIFFVLGGGRGGKREGCLTHRFFWSARGLNYFSEIKEIKRQSANRSRASRAFSRRGVDAFGLSASCQSATVEHLFSRHVAWGWGGQKSGIFKQGPGGCHVGHEWQCNRRPAEDRYEFPPPHGNHSKGRVTSKIRAGRLANLSQSLE